MLYCEDVELLLQDYLDGYLLPSQREVLEAHVRGCEKCRALVGELTRLDSRLGRLCDVDVPSGLSRAILDSLPAQAYGPSPLRRAFTYGAVPLFIVMLVVTGFLAKGRFQLRGRLAERVVEVTLTAPQAVSVAIAGDFNGWNYQSTQMVRAGHEGLWKARLKLPPGVYQYSFVLDGTTWVSDPLAKTMLDDGYGGKNSVFIVDG